MSKVYVIGAKRSPIGSFMGSLSKTNPTEFGAQVVTDLLKQSAIDTKDIDEVIVGNVLSAGLGQGIARQIAVKANIPYSVPANSINMVCGSGMKTVMNGYLSITASNSNIIVCGGSESMSNAPYLVPGQVRSGIKMGEQVMKDHMLFDALTDAFENYHMGVTAENIVRKFDLSRSEQDAFAWDSQQKAIRAQDSGKFNAEITPILIKERRGVISFSSDEYINRNTTLEKLGKLRPAFKKDGSVTAGNSSGINDGASFVLLASEKAVKEYRLKPLVEIVGIGQGGVDPAVMGLGPVPAIRQALINAKLEFKDLDLLELNEAFAAQSLGVIQELSDEHGVSRKDILKKTNINGGAIALGHPVGASGNRIIVTLIHEMLRDKKIKFALASLCIGGGMGTAVIFKKICETIGEK